MRAQSEGTGLSEHARKRQREGSFRGYVTPGACGIASKRGQVKPIASTHAGFVEVDLTDPCEVRYARSHRFMRDLAKPISRIHLRSV